MSQPHFDNIWLHGARKTKGKQKQITMKSLKNRKNAKGKSKAKLFSHGGTEKAESAIQSPVTMKSMKDMK